MLTKYIEAALGTARYEIFSAEETGNKEGIQYYGEIPACPGVYSTADSLEACRNELGEVLEEWILFRIHRHLTMPIIGEIELVIREAEEAA